MGKPYDKSVDLYLYGLLAYEMICGTPTFPFYSDQDEHENRMINGTYTFPDENLNASGSDKAPKKLVSPKKDVAVTYSEISGDGSVQEVKMN